MKRLLLFLLVVLLVVPVLPTAAKTEISYYAFWTGNLDPDSFCEKLVEEGTGYDIVVRKVEHTNSAAVQLMIATEMPDCGWFSMSYDVFNSVANSCHFACFFVWDCNTEFFFNFHNEFYNVQRVCAQVVNESCFHFNFTSFYA